MQQFDRIDRKILDILQRDGRISITDLAQQVGLSATPFRADKVKLCFDSVIKDAGIHGLIQDGYLAQYHHYTLSTDFTSKTYSLLVDNNLVHVESFVDPSAT